MSRQRMTWGGDGRPAPTRRASAHPATPWEGETHPAAYPDPEADAYENGDPSSWAEDPHPPPYRTSVAPAVPYDDGGYRHPATQPGAPAKNASVNVRVAAERKAAKCIRIATALLGPNVASAAQRGDKVATDLIEDQALDFMDLSDARVANTLLRLEASTEDEETLLRKMLAAEGGEGDEKAEDEEGEAKASKKAAEGELMAAIHGLKAEIEALKAGKHFGGEEPPVMAGKHHMGGEEAMLAEMLEQEKMGYGHMGGEEHMSEEDAMLAEMMKEAEEAPAVPPQMAAKAPAVAPQMAGKPFMAEEVEPVMGGFEDPMAMGDEADAMGADEEAILASLFASRLAGAEGDEAAEDEEGEAQASKKAGKKGGEGDELAEEEVEEEEVEEESETAAKKASLRPQPKKASVGAKTIGSQTRVASAGGGDLGDLARLWASAPDVSKVFGG